MVIVQKAEGKSAKLNSTDRIIERPQGVPNLSIDIGTTTVVMELYDSKGNYLDSLAEDNTQLSLGSDVMMRLMHVSEGRGEILTEKIRRQIYEMGCKLIETYSSLWSLKAVPEKISVVGNTVMCHLFLGKDTSGLMGAPFIAAYKGVYQTKGKELGWSEWSDTIVTVLPGIAAHVGADAVAMMGHLRLWDRDKIQMAVDLGTNAEIILNYRGNISACSTAAGPAFEGKGISCGKRAGNAVINGVRFMRGNESICLDVIGEVETLPEPVGICGSGLVDVVAELLRNHLLRPDGYLLSVEEAMQNTMAKKFVQYISIKENGSHAFVLYDRERDGKIQEKANVFLSANLSANKDNGSVKPDKLLQDKDTLQVVVTQEDIRAFQLAKGAIRSGMEVLLQRVGLSVTDLEELHIAGVFGGFLHPKNAVQTGLLPSIPMEKIKFAGNAAGKGASCALNMPEFMDELTERSKTVEHVELAEIEQFSEIYMKAMELYPWGDCAKIG